jgi:addiction module RelB/DinJ family antitoxin
MRLCPTFQVYSKNKSRQSGPGAEILGELGIPMPNAINLYLRQIVLRRGLPFEVTLPPRKPQALKALSGEQIDAELKKALRM